MNSRMVSISASQDECTLLIESNGLGCHDTITLNADQLDEMRTYENRLGVYELGEQPRDLQTEIIKRFREMQKLCNETYVHVYAECQNSVDCG